MDEHLKRCIDYMMMIASNDGTSYPNAHEAAIAAYMEVREENENLAVPRDLKVYMALIPLVTLLLRRKDNGGSGWK